MTHPKHYVGIDVHQKYSEICMLNADGEVVDQARISTTRTALTRWFGKGPRMAICMEAGGSSPWVDRLLRELGHQVVVCNPRRVRLIAESSLKNDEIDAETLARLLRLDADFLHPIKHRSERTQRGRMLLKVRSAHVKSRTMYINSVRGLLRAFGYRISKGTTQTFPKRCRETSLPEELNTLIASSLQGIEAANEQILKLDEEVQALGREYAITEQLQAIPGVGPIVSLAFVLCIEDPDRFKRSRDVAGFLGLRPRLRESSDHRHQGRISKEGDAMMRWLLVQAAHSLIRSRADSDLKRWVMKLIPRVGKKKAVVALARKLAVLMHSLWQTGVVYDPLHRARQEDSMLEHAQSRAVLEEVVSGTR